MIEIKFTGSDWHDIDYQISEFQDRMNGQSVQNKVEETGKTKKKETEPDVTLAEIKTLAKAKMEEQKSKAIKGLLADLGIKKLDQLEEGQYAAFYASLEAL